MNKTTYDGDDDIGDVMLDKDVLNDYVDDYQQLSIYRQRLIKAQIQDIEVNNCNNDYNVDDNDRDRDRDINGDKDMHVDDIVYNNGINLDNDDHTSDTGILMNENNDFTNNLLLYKIEQVIYLICYDMLLININDRMNSKLFIMTR